MKRIAIYTLCKNEEQNISGWLKNVQDADAIFVGDTGSDDRSLELLSAGNVHVSNIHTSPWRFDHARNQLLASIPTNIDICISLDFDERLCDGWRKRVEDAWQQNPTKLEYQYNEILSQHDAYESSITTSRIHSRNDYTWTYPVHERLKYVGASSEKVVFCKGLIITHTPDETKNRSQYRNLLELAVQEEPADFILKHALGRCYIQTKRADDCIAIMNEIRNADCVDENLRKASIRLIGRSYGEKGAYHKAKALLEHLIQEAPFCSSAYAELAALAYQNAMWDDIIELGDQLMNIDFHYKNPYNEFANAKTLLYDIVSFAYSQKRDYENAFIYGQEALSTDKNNVRLQRNVNYYQRRLTQNE